MLHDERYVTNVINDYAVFRNIQPHFFARFCVTVRDVISTENPLSLLRILHEDLQVAVQVYCMRI